MAKVLVTGASGFIGSHTILALLADGHEVRGTLRSIAKGEALLKTLSAFAGEKISVEFKEAELTSDNGWAEAVAGCEYVLHVASPVPAILPKDHNKLIIPARDGVLRVLKVARADGGVRRVVMTSSVAAISYGWADKLPETLTEDDWTDPDNLKDNTAYTRSKAIAERAAWDYVTGEGSGLELATINPSVVLGPVMSGDFSASVQVVSQLMEGRLPAMPNVGFQIVDVRDVADAHVRAMTNPAAAGQRFAITEDFLWFTEVATVLREAYPDRKLPKGTLPDFVVRLLTRINPALNQITPDLGKRRFASNEKAKNLLGWAPRKPKASILASAASLIKHDVV